MKEKRFKIQWLPQFFGVLYFAFAVTAISAQSASIEFPTPITAAEISGRIAARDIGDSRLTTHYYTFNGTQGDIFISIETANLNGDIDIYYAENLRPLTKISVYSDSTASITQREIYLRKPEKLILRVEGRSTGDDAATYSIKFRGSFQAAVAGSQEQPETPEIKGNTDSDVRVNSVGTIIEIKPKPAPAPKQTVAAIDRRSRTVRTPKPISTGKNDSRSAEDSEAESNKAVVTSDLPDETAATTTRVRKGAPPKTIARRPKTTAARKPAPPKSAAITKNEELTKALENVRLIVSFKDGTQLERPMNEILRVNVDRGILTVIEKGGRIGRYSIIDIAKMAIE